MSWVAAPQGTCQLAGGPIAARVPVPACDGRRQAAARHAGELEVLEVEAAVVAQQQRAARPEVRVGPSRKLFQCLEGSQLLA